MDAKITKQRLSRLLSYDWLKIIALAVAAIFFWTLIFTMTATRITPAQQFTVINYTSNRSLSDAFNDSYAKAFKDGVFSYEVLETNVNDLNTAGEYASTVLEARLSTSEGDVIFIPDIGDKDYAKKNEDTGETTYEYTYIESFARRYFTSLYELEGEDGYFARLEKFLNGYYGGDYLNGELDTARAESVFKARIEKNKDKRFKTAAQIEQGVKDEIERIEKYCAAYKEFNGYLQEGLVEYTYVKIVYGKGEKDFREGMYALNICPDESKAGKLKNLFAYQVTEQTEDGNNVSKATAKDMNVLFFKFGDVEESFEYESLLYVNYVIRTSLTQESQSA